VSRIRPQIIDLGAVGIILTFHKEPEGKEITAGLCDYMPQKGGIPWDCLGVILNYFQVAISYVQVMVSYVSYE
jgi:hypothetical protein